jgi:hypothetical protein
MKVVEVRLLGEHPDRQAPLARDLARVGLVDPGGDPQQRRLPGAVRADQADPVAQGDRRIDPVEDHERADLAMDALESQDRHQAAPRGLERSGATWDARAAARLVAAARRVCSARPIRPDPAARRVEPVGIPRAPSEPPISVQRGPRRISLPPLASARRRRPGLGSMPPRMAAAAACSPFGKR